MQTCHRASASDGSALVASCPWDLAQACCNQEARRPEVTPERAHRPKVTLLVRTGRWPSKAKDVKLL